MYLLTPIHAYKFNIFSTRIGRACQLWYSHKFKYISQFSTTPPIQLAVMNELEENVYIIVSIHSSLTRKNIDNRYSFSYIYQSGNQIPVAKFERKSNTRSMKKKSNSTTYTNNGNTMKSILIIVTSNTRTTYTSFQITNWQPFR